MLQSYAELAEKILDNCPGYIEGKRLIQTFFIKSNDQLNKQRLVLRLTIIDSFYSTQMNKRLYGIEEIASDLLRLYPTDRELVEDINIFIETKKVPRNILKLLSNKYGINKRGKPAGVATSLISKYLYFLSEYNFPIYDSLVKDNLPKINERFSLLKNIKLKSTVKQYLECVYEFNKTSKIGDFNQLDNLCWLYGKVKKGSFSLILEKDKYLLLTESIQREKGINIDDEIANLLSKKHIHGVFTDDQNRFIAFVNNVT